MVREYILAFICLPATASRHFAAVARSALMILVLGGLVAWLADPALASALGPDTQPTPELTQRYTDIFGLIGWGVVFSVLSLVLPVIGFFVMLRSGGAIFAGGVIFGFSEQIRLGRQLDGLEALASGLVFYLATICIYLFAGPLGLYHWTIKPLLIRADQADATLCCVPFMTPSGDLTLSSDGRWLLGYKSDSLTWGLSDREAAGSAYLVDTTAGAFVRFPERDGGYSASWRIGQGVKKVGFLHEVNWDVADGRYLMARYTTGKNDALRSEKFDLQRLGLGPVRFDLPMPPEPETFRLLSYVGEEAVFQSLKRKVTLPIGGDTVSMDASGTIAVVLSHGDDESWIDRGTVTFWHIPSGQRIREYWVNYLPKSPAWKVAYGGAVWVYKVEEHIKVFRPLEGWAPGPARPERDPDLPSTPARG